MDAWRGVSGRCDRAAVPRHTVHRHRLAAHLRKVDGIRSVTGLAYVLTVEDPGRFCGSRDVGPYLGLTRRRRQSGDGDPELRITKAGDGFLRPNRYIPYARSAPIYGSLEFPDSTRSGPPPPGGCFCDSQRVTFSDCCPDGSCGSDSHPRSCPSWPASGRERLAGHHSPGVPWHEPNSMIDFFTASQDKGTLVTPIQAG
jgi:hypothetical protein